MPMPINSPTPRTILRTVTPSSFFTLAPPLPPVEVGEEEDVEVELAGTVVVDDSEVDEAVDVLLDKAEVDVGVELVEVVEDVGVGLDEVGGTLVVEEGTLLLLEGGGLVEEDEGTAKT